MAATQLLKFSGVMCTTSRTRKERVSQHLRYDTLQNINIMKELTMSD